MRNQRYLAPALGGLLLLLAASSASADIRWRKDVREALEEGEARGVAILVYLSRDD